MDSGKQGDAKPTNLVSVPKERILESEVSWIGGLLLFFCTIYNLIQFDVLWVFFGIAALTLYILPIVSFRDPFRALPWEMTLLLAAPLILELAAQSQSLNARVSWWDSLSSVAFALSTSTIGFLLTIELQMYTKLRINRSLAVIFVVMFTLAIAGFWQIGEFIGDKVYGTHYQGDNADVMMTLTWNLVGGIIMGIVYALYLRAMPEKRRTTLGMMHIYEVSK